MACCTSDCQEGLRILVQQPGIACARRKVFTSGPHGEPEAPTAPCAPKTANPYRPVLALADRAIRTIAVWRYPDRAIRDSRGAGADPRPRPTYGHRPCDPDHSDSERPSHYPNRL